MTILAAYVPTAEGQAVLDAAVDEARRRDDNLIVARHVENDGAASSPLASEPQRETKARQDLDAIGQGLRGKGVKVDTLMLSDGKDAAKELLDLAESMKVDLIVIGVRRRSPVGKAFLGSEAQDIILNANCPVLAVKAQ